MQTSNDQPNKLSFDDIVNAVKVLGESKSNIVLFKEHPFLLGMQTIIKDTNCFYYPADIKPGEIKVITFRNDHEELPFTPLFHSYGQAKDFYEKESKIINNEDEKIEQMNEAAEVRRWL